MLEYDDTTKYFTRTCFFNSVFDIKKLPKDVHAEIALVGRSNTGKSSIINTITHKKNLAIVSKTPGRTRSINYFEVQNHKYLVDLPGYGYAKVNHNIKSFWEEILQKYFQSRSCLKGIILIIDIRIFLNHLDQAMLLFGHKNNLPIHIVFNKADQLNQQQRRVRIEEAAQDLSDFNSVSWQLFSCLKLIGVEELQQKIIDWMER